MSHLDNDLFVKCVSQSLPYFFEGVKVLEVGSLDINGSIKKFFNNCNYIGIDVAEGEGVDVVCQAQNYNAPDSSFDVIISCEMMEHNPYWVETFSNMIRLCKPGGLIIMSCATRGRAEHGTQRSSPESSPLSVGIGWDYYKNLCESDFNENFNLKQEFAFSQFFINYNHYDLYFFGIKKGNVDCHTDDIIQARKSVQAVIDEINSSFSARIKKLLLIFSDSQLDYIRGFFRKFKNHSS